MANSVLGILLTHDKPPTANPISVPFSLSSKHAKLSTESFYTRPRVEPRAFPGDESQHKCAPKSEETEIAERPLTFISMLLGADCVEHITAVNETPDCVVVFFETQDEFTLTTRDYCFEASVSGWNYRLHSNAWLHPVAQFVPLAVNSTATAYLYS